MGVTPRFCHPTVPGPLVSLFNKKMCIVLSTVRSPSGGWNSRSSPSRQLRRRSSDCLSDAPGGDVPRRGYRRALPLPSPNRHHDPVQSGGVAVKLATPTASPRPSQTNPRRNPTPSVWPGNVGNPWKWTIRILVSDRRMTSGSKRSLTITTKFAAERTLNRHSNGTAHTGDGGFSSVKSSELRSSGTMSRPTWDSMLSATLASAAS